MEKCNIAIALLGKCVAKVIFSLSHLRAKKSNNYRKSWESNNFRDSYKKKQRAEKLSKQKKSKSFTRSNREKYNIDISSTKPKKIVAQIKLKLFCNDKKCVKVLLVHLKFIILLPLRLKKKTIAIAIVGRAITIRRAIQKRSHKAMYKTIQKMKQRC